jgi:hypothetical protein
MESNLLQDRASKCLARLSAAERAKGGVDEATALDGLLREFGRAAKPFFEACAKLLLLREEKIKVPVQAALRKQQQSIGNVSSRFREKSEAATLKQGRRWSSLVDAVGEATKLVDDSLSEGWRTFVGSELFGGQEPDREERLLAKTPENRRALQEYRRLFSEFSQLRSTPPSEKEAISRLRALSGELGKIQFQRDVPRAVRDFLEAAGTSGGASMGLLTNEVAAWLLDNNLLDNYVVKARIN